MAWMLMRNMPVCWKTASTRDPMLVRKMLKVTNVSQIKKAPDAKIMTEMSQMAMLYEGRRPE